MKAQKLSYNFGLLHGFSTAQNCFHFVDCSVLNRIALPVCSFSSYFVGFQTGKIILSLQY